MTSDYFHYSEIRSMYPAPFPVNPQQSVIIIELIIGKECFYSEEEILFSGKGITGKFKKL